VKGRAGGGDLGQAPLDRGVDVLVSCAELELTAVQFTFDAAQAALDRRELRAGQKVRLGETPRVGDAPGDVEGVELEIRLERRRESLKLGMKGLAEAGAPKLSGTPSPARGRGAGVGAGTTSISYGVSLFTSPSRLPSSRACSWPWTRAEVRTPIPQSLMNPAAADWSNSSPFPYVARDS
jgi:hypothetical protein